VEALLVELQVERGVLAEELDTVFLGGGTPTLTEPAQLARLLDALPTADEVTVEANPETVTPEVARMLHAHGVNRVSLGAQSFQPHLLDVLERRAAPDVVRRAFYALRDVNFDNISLDLLYGIPGQSTADLERDLSEALTLAPEHLSWYELEAKPGTRFTHRHGVDLKGQAEAMEAYFERVVEVLTEAGYRWYETANFCLEPARVGGRDLRAQHNLAYWQGRDYLGLGIGAVSTLQSVRSRNTPKLREYLDALETGTPPPRDREPLDESVRERERLMLGLRLDEPLELGTVAAAVEPLAVAKLERLGLLHRSGRPAAENLRLTRRGRFLGGAVTAELLR
jgi:oxygen-independent coproporphyrinogen-3 oxidase